MKYLCYLPEVIVLLSLVAAVWTVIRLLWAVVDVHWSGTRCIACKEKAVKETGYPCLFLLPISFGDTYEHPEAYLSANMTAIQSKEQIPSGKRACGVEVYRCPSCGNRQVEIRDFLLVRGQESVKGCYTFPYESFAHVMEQK